MRRLDAEAENLASVMRHLLDVGRLDEAAEYAWSLYLYLWIGGLLGVVRDWMAELLERAERDGIPLAPRTEAIALYYTRAVAYWQEPDLDVRPGLERSAALFDEAADPFGASLSRVSLALGHLTAPGAPDVVSARAVLERSLAGFAAAGDAWGQAMAHVTLGRIDLAVNDMPGAATHFDESYRLAASSGEMLGLVIAQHHRGLAQAVHRRHPRCRGGLRRVPRHVAGDEPRRGHRLRAAGADRRSGRAGRCRADGSAARCRTAACAGAPGSSTRPGSRWKGRWCRRCASMAMPPRWMPPSRRARSCRSRR